MRWEWRWQKVIWQQNLTRRGTHYRIYEKLGAHLMTFEGARGVAFAVWAPNAKSVSVIGSFNGWNTRRHPMRLLGTSGIWELFIPRCSCERIVCV